MRTAKRSTSGAERISIRGGFWAGLGGVAVLALLLAPALGASGAPKGYTLVAPFPGTSYAANSLTVQGCGSASLPSAARFSQHSGLGSFRDQAAGRGCVTGGQIDTQMVVENDLSWFTWLSPTVFGHRVLTENWFLNFTVGLRANLTSQCVGHSNSFYYCEQLVASEVQISGFLYDTNNGSVTNLSLWAEGADQSRFTQCQAPSGSSNLTCVNYNNSFGSLGTSKLSFHATPSASVYLVQSHGYQLFTDVIGLCDVSFVTDLASFGFTPSGAASLNAATYHNGVHLESVTIR